MECIGDFERSGLDVDFDEYVDDDSGECDETEADVRVTAYDVWNEYAAEFVAVRKNKLHISPLITADYENNKKHRIKNKMTKPDNKHVTNNHFN